MKHWMSVCAVGSLLSLAIAAQAQNSGSDAVNSDIAPRPPTSLPMPHEPHPQEGTERFDQRGHAFFGDADTDSDGILSVTEARAALPQFIVEDNDLDGKVSQAEAEAVLPELNFVARGREGGDAPIGETEFGMIVMALNERDVDQTITPERESQPPVPTGNSGL